MTVQTKRIRASKVPAAPVLTVVNKPKLAAVSSIAERHKRSVGNELRRLLARVEAGDIIGIGYVTFAADKQLSAGLAGVAARNRMAAAGAMMSAAMATAREACDEAGG
jgi:hypothetical protein